MTHVPVPPPDERDWERAERRLFAARDAELAAAPPPDLRRGLRRLLVVTALATGVAAGAALMYFKLAGAGAGDIDGSTARPGAAAPLAAAPTRIKTPPGGGTRLALGDAVVEVGGDAELSVETAGDGTITLRLATGLVDCEVEPRPGRAPFHVVAGDVRVTVVGTRFSVERDAARGVRVGVTRGRVRVAEPTGERPLDAGQAWDARRGVIALAELDDPDAAAAAAAAAAPARDAGPGQASASAAASSSSAPDASPALDPSVPPAQALADARALEASDPSAAAARLAALAAGAADPVVADTAAWRLARLELARQRWDAALAAAADYERRFARGAHLEDVLWLRVEAHCAGYRSRAAEQAARAYARRFPEGPHAAAATSGAPCGQ